MSLITFLVIFEGDMTFRERLVERCWQHQTRLSVLLNLDTRWSTMLNSEIISDQPSNPSEGDLLKKNEKNRNSDFLRDHQNRFEIVPIINAVV